jgi:excisionase family DNA binding protein
VPADNLRQTFTTAVAIVEAAAGAPALAVEVMSTDDLNRRNGIEPIPELVSVTEASELLGVTLQRVLQLVDAGALASQRVGNAVVIPRAAVEKRLGEHTADTLCDVAEGRPSAQ